jgi:membrane protein required for colicin V production
MIINVVVVLLLAGFVVHGYGQGFFRGLSSLVTPILGIVIAFRKCDTLAVPLGSYIHNEAVCRVASFLVILFAVWLAMRLSRKLLSKLVDWQGMPGLDRFSGGILGLAKGTAMVWLLLAASLIVLPSSVRVIERSQASMRVLSLVERIITPNQEQGKATAVHDTRGNPENSLALLQHSNGAAHHE